MHENVVSCIYMKVIPKPMAFIWDKGNTDKNPSKHGVTNQETEEAFFDQKRKILRDTLHSQNEDRYILLGKTKQGLILFIVFTIREKGIRVISARKMNRREEYLYEKKA